MASSLARRIRRLPLNNTWASEKDLDRLAAQLRAEWNRRKAARRAAARRKAA